MGKKFRSILRFLALMLIIVSVLVGCSKKDDLPTSLQEVASVPTEEPTKALTDEPTATPTVTPTEAPTATPTVTPTEAPTATPTVTPTDEPAVAPTADAAAATTEVPSATATASSKVSTETVSSENPANKEPSEGMFDPWYSVKTSIAYSSGTDSDWSYGNQRKEFAVTKPCYVRIGSSIVAIWHWGKRYGEGNQITVTYRFTGAEHCRIEISDGFATAIKTEDPNVLEFTRTVTAKGSDEEDVVVFRYTPEQVGSISLEVIYDNQIKSQFDERNTMYLVAEDY